MEESDKQGSPLTSQSLLRNKASFEIRQFIMVCSNIDDFHDISF